jgi:hypothetical protein
MVMRCFAQSLCAIGADTFKGALIVSAHANEEGAMQWSSQSSSEGERMRVLPHLDASFVFERKEVFPFANGLTLAVAFKVLLA